jgi:hypothetical protein
MKKIHFISVTLFTAFSVFFVSCRKEEEETTYDDTNYNQEASASIVDKALEEEEDGLTLKNFDGSSACNFNYSNSCATISESSSSFPKTITVDYGTGCTDWFGRTRSGKIFIHLTDSFMNDNAVRTVTFENFYINGIGISGSRTTTNTGLNSNGQPTFTRVIETELSTSNGNFERNFTHQLTWIEGYNTPACFDNVWSITGAGNIVRPSGVVVARSITSPLIVGFNCQYIVSGVVEIYSLQGTWTMNFGDGTCDNTATVTRPNGVIINVSM